jgi:DtxR family Mn-dependent transcriptional regulator
MTYLKAVYLLEEEASPGRAGSPDKLNRVSTTAVAERLDVSAASATNMLKKLGARHLVDYEPYRGASLTPKGREIVLELVRHHRLLETYLVRALGVPWDEAHAEAELLEGDLSEALEERISVALGHPRVDPHGHPIPTKDGAMPKTSRRSLWDVGNGKTAVVEQVPDSHPEALRYLGKVGLLPGVGVTVVDRGPIGGPLFIQFNDDQTAPAALSREIAEAIWVR